MLSSQPTLSSAIQKSVATLADRSFNSCSMYNSGVPLHLLSVIDPAFPSDLSSELLGAHHSRLKDVFDYFTMNYPDHINTSIGKLQRDTQHFVRTRLMDGLTRTESRRTLDGGKVTEDDRDKVKEALLMEELIESILVDLAEEQSTHP